MIIDETTIVRTTDVLGNKLNYVLVDCPNCGKTVEVKSKIHKKKCNFECAYCLEDLEFREEK